MKRCVRLGAVGALAVGFFMGAADWAAAEETQVNTYTVNAQGDPSVAMDADGDFVVTWESNGQSGGTFAMNDVGSISTNRTVSASDSVALTDVAAVDATRIVNGADSVAMGATRD